VGMKGSSTVTLPEMTTETNTFYVDPLTGAQLNETQNEHVALVDSTGAQRLLLLNASLSFTPQSLTKVVHIDKGARNEITWLKVTGPLAAGVVGILLLAGGILLARPRRDDQPEYSDSESTEPALDPAL
jgi:Porin PorA